MAEAENAANAAVKLARSIADQTVSKYLLAIALLIQGKSTIEIDAELERLCNAVFEIGWSFEGFENWLEKIDISQPIKSYIRKKTELLKKHKKQKDK